MSINISKTFSRDRKKVYYKLDFGRHAGARVSTGIFTFAKPENQIQKDHNKDAMKILELKKSQMILDAQSISSGYIPQHKFKANFFDYYEEFIKLNRRFGNRHLECSLQSLKDFVDRPLLAPSDITENFCERFRQYLLDRLNGETPMNYFGRFKRVVKNATKDGYFRHSPADNIKAKSNLNVLEKDILEEDEYLKLLATPCNNSEIKHAFLFSLYTGLRWIDIKNLQWESISDDNGTFKIFQKKTGVPLKRPLHELARKLIGDRKTGLIFDLPTADGANKVLKAWAKKSGIKKNITWHCARHSFSVLLLGKGIEDATVAGYLGHTTTKFVQTRYKRYKNSNAVDAIQKLPDFPGLGS